MQKEKNNLANSKENFVRIGVSSCSIAAGTLEIFEEFLKEIERRKLSVKVKKCGCLGICYAEPFAEVKTEGLPPVIYGRLRKEDVTKIIESHIENKRLVEGLIYEVRSKNALNPEEDSFLKSTEFNKTIIFIADTDFSSEEKLLEFYDLFRLKLKEEKAEIVRVADLGIYKKGIVIKILPLNVVYYNFKKEDIDRIITLTVKKKEIMKGFLLEQEPKQYRIVLRNCGLIDPEFIEDYKERAGYKALEKVLFEFTPQQVIEEIEKSKLRGRGGAGFPTGLKWKFAQKASSEEKYIVCNADEGDPGAYMDRSILEGDPHTVIEGMIIAGYAVGAKKGYFYIRAEYPLAIQRVKKAVEQAYKDKLLGKNILGSKFSFDIEIRLGAGAFVCGEETALIASLEGKRGTPRPRPPYPSEKGLWRKPTVINNVETLANVPMIILKGAEWFTSIGTENSTGTKVFALTGKIRNSGLIEVPMGITLKEIVYEIGGGISSQKRLKAIQTGGPSGGVIPEKLIDVVVDYESFKSLGSIMGSGGMIVMDEEDCMVDVAKFYLGFCVDESCGKCAPCRIGGYQMLNILSKISKGEAELEDLNKLRRIAKAMQKASLCGLGQTAPNPVLSTLKYFESEYKTHIIEKRCPALKCRELITYSILQSKCARCGLCAKKCPVKAIAGDRQTGFYIQLDKCIKCGECFEICRFGAIDRK